MRVATMATVLSTFIVEFCLNWVYRHQMQFYQLVSFKSNEKSKSRTQDWKLFLEYQVLANSCWFSFINWAGSGLLYNKPTTKVNFNSLKFCFRAHSIGCQNGKWSV